jgi:hypothetical protein
MGFMRKSANWLRMVTLQECHLPTAGLPCCPYYLDNIRYYRKVSSGRLGIFLKEKKWEYDIQN